MSVPASYLRVPHLREWRLRSGLSQEDLAELAGVSRSTVANAERGDADVLPRTLQAFCKALKIKPHQLRSAPPD